MFTEIKANEVTKRIKVSRLSDEIVYQNCIEEGGGASKK